MNLLAKTALAGLATLLVIQLIPYGKNHTNPPVQREPNWDTPLTRELVRKACFNCHSNETIWPWYAAIAPASWLVWYDVASARKKLNFSDWQDGAKEGEAPAIVARQIMDGHMPPGRYTIAHPEARLTKEQKDRLIQGLPATVRASLKMLP